MSLSSLEEAEFRKIDPEQLKVTLKEEFRDVEKIEKAILDMTEEQMEAIKNAFASYDKQLNGTILPKALIKALRLLGHNPTQEKVDSILCVVSPNGTEVITFVDFVRIICVISANLDEVIEEAFSMFDADGSGSITREEFRQKMLTSGTSITLEEVNEIIAEADVDGDGEINLREFARMLQQ